MLNKAYLWLFFFLLLFLGMFFFHPPQILAQLCSGGGGDTYTLYGCDWQFGGCVANPQNDYHTCMNTTGANTCAAAQCGYCESGGETCSSYWDPNYCGPGCGGYVCTIQNVYHGQYSPPCLSFARLGYGGCSCQLPNCDDPGSIVCNGCSYQYNSCYAGNGTGVNCYYTTHNGSSSCTQVSAPNQGGWCTANNCDGSLGYFCSNGSCVRNCNSNPINCRACTGGSLPTNTCGTANNGAQDCTWSAWDGQAGCIQQPDNNQVCSMFVNNCSNTFVCTNGNSCRTTLSAHAFTDLNHNGTQDAEDQNRQSVTISISPATATGITSLQTDANGNVTFTDLTQGTYTITVTAPANTQISTQNSFQVTVDSNNPGNISVGNFGITPVYTISGVICNDPEIDGSCVGDSDLPGANSVIITPVTPDGTVVGSVAQATYKTSGAQVLSGTYTVSFAASNGYYFTATKVPNKTVPPFTVSVGASSSVDAQGHPYTCVAPPAGTSDASCSNGNIINLNFALSNLQAWFQGACTDLRVETSGVDDPVPNTGSCGKVSNSFAIVAPKNNSAAIGIYFSGQNSPSFGYNGGQASFPNYVISQPYPSNFTPVSGVTRDTYDYLLATANSSGITPVDLSGIDPTTGFPYCGAGGVADCDFETTLPDGVYIVPSSANGGNLTLDLTHILPDPGNFKSYVFLVSGKLTITSNVLVPSATSAIFAVKGDITVDASIGETDATSLMPDIEGLYSTEGDLWILSNSPAYGSVCAAGGGSIDKRLNLYGSMVIGGTLHNQRDLCSSDVCPSLYFDFCGSGGGGGGGGGSGQRCLYDTDCSGGLTCNVSGNNCVCSNGSTPGNCPLGSGGSGGDGGPGSGSGSGGSGTNCLSDSDCQGTLACNASGSGSGACTCGAGSRPGTCAGGNGSGGTGTTCIADSDCQANLSCDARNGGGTCTCEAGARPGTCGGGTGSMCSSDSDCQGSLSCNSAGGGTCTCGAGSRPGTCGNGTGGTGAICTADSDCLANLACNAAGGTSCTCGAGGTPGTCGGGGTTGNRCVYDTDCQGNLSCTTAGGGTCTCGAGSRPGTCTLGNGDVSGGGTGGSGNSCIYDADCQVGLVCNSAGGNACTCGGGTMPGTCTLGSGGASGGNGGNGGNAGQGDTVLEFLLNAPSFVKHRDQLWQEVAPVGN